MAGAVTRCSAAKAETHAWKLRLEGTLGTLGSAAEAVTRLTAATLQAADVLAGRGSEVSCRWHCCAKARLQRCAVRLQAVRCCPPPPCTQRQL